MCKYVPLPKKNLNKCLRNYDFLDLFAFMANKIVHSFFLIWDL